MIKINGLSVSRIPINGKETLRVMKNGVQLWSGTGLPAGYTLLEYIESTGSQYIDTGFKPNQDTSIILDSKFELTSSSKWLFCGRTAASDSAFGMYSYSNTTTLYFIYGTKQVKFSTAFTSERKIFSVNKNKATVGSETVTASEQTFESNATLCLLARNTNGSVEAFTSAKIYSCKIYDNDTLIRDFIPCKNPSGVYGLYDKVNKQFYASASSTPFTGA